MTIATTGIHPDRICAMGGQASLLVFGDINVDVMAQLPAALVPGSDNHPRQLEFHLGGVGANVAVTLAKWGVAARMAGCVGRDAFGEMALAALTRQGADVSAVARADAVTGVFVIPVDPDGRRTLIGSRSANELGPVSRPAECVEGMAGIHLVGYTLLNEPTAKWTRELIDTAGTRGIPVSLDAGVAPCHGARAQILELAPRLDVLFVGQEETEALTGQSGAGALTAIAAVGARTVILKQGAAGCQFMPSAGGRWWKVAPLEVHAVDTTGAGDAFAAGYWIARLRGWEAGDCVSLANACGAAAAATLGAGEAMPGPDDVMRVLEQQPSGGRESSAAQRLLRLLRAEAKLARA